MLTFSDFTVVHTTVVPTCADFTVEHTTEVPTCADFTDQVSMERSKYFGVNFLRPCLQK